MTTTTPAATLGPAPYAYTAVAGWERLPEGWSFGEVAAVAADSRGNVSVFNRGEHPVIRFDADGRYQEEWGHGLFRRPHGLCIGPDDALYYIDDLGHTIRKYSPDGRLLLQLGDGSPSDTGATSVDYRTIVRSGAPFHYPTDVAVAPNGDLYISDGYGNARVHRFSPDGRLLHSWGEPGTGPGEFRIPHGIAVDRDGRVWVADRENSRLQIFDAEGRFVAEWADLARPCAVFVDPQGTVYVAELGFRAGMWPGTEPPSPDATGGRLSIFDPCGRLLARCGGGADPMAPHDFFAPHDIWVDGPGAIYVGEVTLSAGGNRGLVPPGCPCLRKFVPSPRARRDAGVPG
jgi:DNA-binding beta-propeller fold protein YncE